MAKKKVQKPVEEKLENTDLNLFEVLAAIDQKDYGYYDRLTDEQKKKFVPYMLVQWMSAIKGSSDLQTYYLKSTEYHANTHLVNYMIASKEHAHPKLQWLMLCAASPGMGKMFHQWIPQIKEKYTNLRELASNKDVVDYFKKIYPKVNEETIIELGEAYVVQQRRKTHLASRFPNMKIDEIELLSDLISDEEIERYERELGN